MDGLSKKKKKKKKREREKAHGYGQWCCGRQGEIGKDMEAGIGGIHGYGWKLD